MPADFARQLSISEDDLKNADTFDVSVSIPGTLAELSSLAKQAETPAGKDQPGQADGRPFAGAHTDPALNLQLLEASLRNIPQQKDSERPKHYVPVSLSGHELRSSKQFFVFLAEAMEMSVVLPVDGSDLSLWRHGKASVTCAEA